MNQHSKIARRAFLQRIGQLGIAGTAAPWAINLAAISDAAAFTTGQALAVDGGVTAM